MAETLYINPDSDRRLTLATIVVLHALVFYFVNNARQHAPTKGVDSLALPIHFFFLQQQGASSSQNAPVMHHNQRLRSTVTPKSTSLDHVAPPITAVPPIDTSSSDIMTGDIISAAKRDIGKIDRELENGFSKIGSFKHQAKVSESVTSKLEKGIAAAAVLMPGTIQEKTFPDGRKVARVIGANGSSYCVTSKSVGAHDGIDHMQRGMQLMVTGCDHLFD